jgi:hypothetical protein
VYQDFPGSPAKLKVDPLGSKMELDFQKYVNSKQRPGRKRFERRYWHNRA